jgi:hypothetical protein
MRYVLIAATLAAWPTHAQDPFLTGDALQEAVKAQCAEGRIVLNRASSDALEAAMRHFAAQAYQEGKREGSSLCRL